MTKPARDANLRWLGFLLAALVAVLVTLFGVGTASAATATAAQTRVGPQTLVAQVVVGPHGGIGAGQRLGNDLPAYDFVLATGVAAKAGTGRLSTLLQSGERGSISFGSKAAARQGLPGEAGTAANRFFRGATAKSQDFQAQELGGGGYRLQFFSPARNAGYGKLYVQEIDSLGNVSLEFKNTMGPDGLIETKWIHGGP